MKRRQKPIEKKSKLHDRWVEEIFKEPAKLPIKIQGEIIRKLKFPKSVFTKKELADLILVAKKEKIIHIFFIEIKTGLFGGGKAKQQVKTALKFFLKEFNFWKEKLEIRNYEIKKIIIHSLLIWIDKTAVPPSLRVESQYKKIIA